QILRPADPVCASAQSGAPRSRVLRMTLHWRTGGSGRAETSLFPLQTRDAWARPSAGSGHPESDDRTLCFTTLATETKASHGWGTRHFGSGPAAKDPMSQKCDMGHPALITPKHR